MRMRVLYTIPRTCPLDGMVDQYLIGYTSYMDWEWSISVRYVEIQVIGVERPLRITFRAGVIHMA